jgi:hypothetical protein
MADVELLLDQLQTFDQPHLAWGDVLTRRLTFAFSQAVHLHDENPGVRMSQASLYRHQMIVCRQYLRPDSNSPTTKQSGSS